MENGCSYRNSGPVALTLPPPMPFRTKALRQDVAGGTGAMSCSQSAAESAVQLVCTNPGCTVATWMDADDWQARVTSAQRQTQRRGWNGDEDDWRPDHGGSSAAFHEQLACPCGRGWRRRATMPSTSSPAAIAARLDRLQQLRLMRRSEPMLATGPSHLAAGWPGPSNWSVPPSEADVGLRMSRAAAVQPHFGFCSQVIGTERFRPENHVAVSRHRVFSEPETYDSTNHCVTGGNMHHSRSLANGYKPQPVQLDSSSSVPMYFCTSSQDLKLKSVDVLVQRGYPHASQRNLTPKRPSRPDVVSDGLPSTVNVCPGPRAPPDARPDSSRRDGASPDSMSSDGGSSAASTGSATERRKPSSAARLGSTGSSRGNIFRQRTPSELASFRALSVHCNAYEVQTAGDDAPYGKDRLRTHVLVALSSARRSTVDCVICSSSMVVYHDFPLLDGLFFESPMRYNSDVRVEPLTIGGLHRQPLSDASKFYLSAVCFKCLQVNYLRPLFNALLLVVCYISKFCSAYAS